MCKYAIKFVAFYQIMCSLFSQLVYFKIKKTITVVVIKYEHQSMLNTLHWQTPGVAK